MNTVLVIIGVVTLLCCAFGVIYIAYLKFKGIATRSKMYEDYLKRKRHS